MRISGAAGSIDAMASRDGAAGCTLLLIVNKIHERPLCTKASGEPAMKGCSGGGTIERK
jgi:hypothetical protein